MGGWGSVGGGEEKWILGYEENGDGMLKWGVVLEVGVLKE